ncbi:hypothetical protein CUMW_235840 [Citrus unshiu]|uniref:Uncharacterized protein n=1 Tax=Citrus unshiu TaxID=55188 RepID=A0A2H5QJE8_CITUN|nr:hypothetical protein CUMW_235840 [Citrus unshiu]
MINGGTSTTLFLVQSISNTRIAVVKGFGGTPQLLLNHLCPATLLGNSAWINSNKEQGLHRHSLGFSLSLNLAIYLLYSVYSSLPLLLSHWQILSYILIRAFTHI